jgi:hypothetical protein
MGAHLLNQPVVGMASSPSGNGYWLVAADGGIFSFGDAQFHGSTGAIRLNQPIVGMAAHNSGAGYWFVARDGGVFAFGAAPYYGSTAGEVAPETVTVQTMIGYQSGRGYNLIAWDNPGAMARIRRFGDAPYYGNTPGGLTSRVVAAASVGSPIDAHLSPPPQGEL